VSEAFTSSAPAAREGASRENPDVQPLDSRRSLEHDGTMPRTGPAVPVPTGLRSRTLCASDVEGAVLTVNAATEHADAYHTPHELRIEFSDADPNRRQRDPLLDNPSDPHPFLNALMDLALLTAHDRSQRRYTSMGTRRRHETRRQDERQRHPLRPRRMDHRTARVGLLLRGDHPPRHGSACSSKLRTWRRKPARPIPASAEARGNGGRGSSKTPGPRACANGSTASRI
jgi:hypothetical protein